MLNEKLHFDWLINAMMLPPKKPKLHETYDTLYSSIYKLDSIHVIAWSILYRRKEKVPLFCS